MRDCAEKQQQQAEQKYRCLADVLFDGIVILDGETIIELNARSAEIYGFAVSELVGKNVADLFAPEYVPLVLGHIRAGNEESCEHRAKRKDGSTFSAEVRVKTLQTGGETLTFCAVRDNTARERVKEALQENRKKLDKVQRLAHLGSWEYDLERDSLTWSDEVSRIFGLTPGGSGVTPEAFLDAVHPGDKERVQIAFSDAVRDGAPLNLVHRIVRKNDGETRYVHNVCEHVREESGRIVQSLGIVHDITERKLAQKNIERIATEWMITVDASTDVICLLDLDWRLKRANLAFYSMTGTKPKDILGRRVWEILKPGGGEASTPLSRMFEGKSGFVTTLEADHPDNPLKRPIEITVRTVPDKAGQPVSIFLNFHDLSHERKLQEEKARLTAQLQNAKKVEAIGRIAGGFAHEVRNPLNAILSISEALFSEKEIKENPEYQPYIRHIRAQVNRLAQLMKDLLELGRPILPASLASVSLSDVCSDTLNLWRSSDFAKTHPVNLSFAGLEPRPRVVADGARLQQVFLNLLDNAAQHSPAGSETMIRVLEPEGPFVRVWFIDAGKGIPQDEIDRIFDPFFTTRKGGTGLGLSLVKHFVENMGGEIAICNNDPPPGCTAEVKLRSGRGDPA